jgi:hypothetical protein
LQLEVKMDPAAMAKAGISLEQPVTFSVTDATVDELFEQLLRPVGCTFRRQGQVIEILPAK